MSDRERANPAHAVAVGLATNGDPARPSVLHVTPWFWPARAYGGPVESVLGLCRAQAGLAARVRVLTTNANGADTLDIETRRPVALAPRLDVHYCRRTMFDAVSLAFLRALREAVGRAEVVHLSGVYSFPTIPTLLACRAQDKPLVWTPRGMLQRWPDRRRPRLKRAWVALCRRLVPPRTRVHFTSNAERTESEAIGDPTPAVIPNGVDLPAHVATPPGRDDGLRLLYVGRLAPIKGIENLLHAVARLPGPARDAWSLVVAGGGPPGYVAGLRRLADTLGLTGRVRWHGPVDETARAALFADAAAVVVPSHRESFGMVVAEALAHGRAVVAARGAPWPELDARGCGLWVDNDPAALAEALGRLPDLPLAEMGQRGRAWMRREFAWPVVAERMIDVYGTLVREARGR